MSFSATLQNLRQMPLDQQAEWATRVLPPWISLLLVLALAWKLAELAWLLVPKPAADDAPASTSASLGSAQTYQPAGADVPRLVEGIKNANLFGKVQAAPVAPKPSDGPIDPTTDKSLVLYGAVASDDDTQAFAIIGQKNKDHKAYFVGDIIPGNAKLHTIGYSHVVLDRTGKLEQLDLSRESTGRATSSRRPTTRPQARASLQNLRREVAKNPAKLTDIIRPQPVFADGKQVGYRVYPGRERQRFIQLGLKPGDLVTQINDTTLDDPAKGTQIFQELSNATELNVTVERNGQPQVLTLKLGD